MQTFGDIAGALREVAENLERSYGGCAVYVVQRGRISDSNGNTIGIWKTVDDAQRA